MQRVKPEKARGSEHRTTFCHLVFNLSDCSVNPAELIKTEFQSRTVDSQQNVSVSAGASADAKTSETA